jgi:hypothetical protein
MVGKIEEQAKELGREPGKSAVEEGFAEDVLWRRSAIGSCRELGEARA